jgi:hypothetical protein
LVRPGSSDHFCRAGGCLWPISEATAARIGGRSLGNDRPRGIEDKLRQRDDRIRDRIMAARAAADSASSAGPQVKPPRPSRGPPAEMSALTRAGLTRRQKVKQHQCAFAETAASPSCPCRGWNGCAWRRRAARSAIWRSRALGRSPGASWSTGFPPARTGGRAC